MHRVRRINEALGGLVLVTGLSLAACDNGSSGGQATAPSATASVVSSAQVLPPAPSASASAAETAEDEAAMDDDVRDYHRHHSGGIASFIALAIDSLGLDAGKKAQVQAIQTTLRTKLAPARDAGHVVLSTIADGIAAGKIDAASVDAAVAKAATASAGEHAATMDAITQLHDLLSPAERSALIEKVQAHWAVWRKVNIDEKANSKDKGSRLDKLTTLLHLTVEQQDSITKALAADAPASPQADPKPVDSYVQAFSTAFAADKFDPKSLDAPSNAAAGHVARNGGARLARFYEAVTPLLTPDQRTLLASHLRARLSDDQPTTSQ